MITSFKITDKLYINRNTNSAAPQVVQPAAVDHIVVLDCSGSMSYELPKIREQLKERIRTMVPQDSVSLIWFSGRGEFGALFEGVVVDELRKLAKLDEIIDRWIRPVGMTGFKEPLEMVTKLVGKLREKREAPISLFFMSDGCDNQWPRESVVKAIRDAAKGLQAATIVEYGYYADRQLLAQMAQAVGGAHIFANGFTEFRPMLTAAMEKKPAPNKVRMVASGAINDIAWTMHTHVTEQWRVDDNVALVPEDTSELWWLSSEPTGRCENLFDVDFDLSRAHVTQAALYAALGIFGTRMKSDIVTSILAILGDVRFINMYQNCFGKQAYTAFCKAVDHAAYEPTKRLIEGYDRTRMPDSNAFTVLDLLATLAADDGNRVLLDEGFRYNRIGRARVDASDLLTDEEQSKLDDLVDRLSKARHASEKAALALEIAALTSSRNGALRFEEERPKDGYPINGLVWNEERPNVSFRVKKEGHVDLTERLNGVSGETWAASVPKKLRTYIWRNYTVIKDGLLNIDVLPVRVTQNTWDVLRTALPRGSMSWSGDGKVNIQLSALPIINRRMFNECSMGAAVDLEFALTRNRAHQKVYNHFQKAFAPKTSKGFESLFGADAAKWLAEQGLTDYNGFNPQTVQAQATDVYMGKELAIKLKGYSTLPSVADVEKGIKTGKLNAPGKLMAEALAEVQKAQESPKTFATWIEGKAKSTTAETRALLFEKSQLVFAIIMGQRWFSEFSSLDEDTVKRKIEGEWITAKAELKEIEIEI